MKRNVVFTSIIIAIVGLATYGFIGKQEDVKIIELNTEAVVVNKTAVDIKYKGIESYGIRVTVVNEDMFYLVRRRYDRPITKEILEKAESIEDVISDYPVKSITEYISVEIYTIGNSTEMKAVGSNDILTSDQKNILSSVEISSDIVVNVNYKNKNTITNTIVDRQMSTSMTVIPEVEAEYIGGYEHMITYLRNNSDDKILALDPEKIERSTVLFTVNEKGEIENVILDKTTGDTEADQSLVDLVSSMPKWKPAEDANGSRVKQKFEFMIGLNGC